MNFRKILIFSLVFVVSAVGFGVGVYDTPKLAEAISLQGSLQGTGTETITNISNLAVGTSTMSGAVYVVGNITATGDIVADNIGGTTTISSGNVSSGEFGSNTGGGNYVFPADLYINANVGIGTTSPSGTLKLDVEGQVGATQYCDESGSNCIDIANTVSRYNQLLGFGNRRIHSWDGLLTMTTDTGGEDGPYLIIETNVPQDSFLMGGFTLRLDESYNPGSSYLKADIRITGYWNPESNGGFTGFRYQSNNVKYNPPIQVGRRISDGKTVFIVSVTSGNYLQALAQDLFLGYSNSSDLISYGEGWNMSFADDLAAYTNLDTVVSDTTMGSGSGLDADTIDGHNYSSNWESTGDITGVTAGTGLTGGGTSGSVTVNADTGYLQRRVSSSCATGSSIRVINSDGTVSCESDTDTFNDGWDLYDNGVYEDRISEFEDLDFNSGTGVNVSYDGVDDLTFSADTSYLQRRVSSSCAAGSSIRVINSDGTVSCEVDDTGGGLWTESGSNIYYNSGSVGIGTTSPSSKLSVGGSGSSNYNAWVKAPSGGGAIYGEAYELSSYGVLGVADTGVYGSGATYGVWGTGGYGVYGSGTNYGVFGKGSTWGVKGEDTNSTSYAYLGYGDYGVYASGVKNFLGNIVGIGTTSPNAKLHLRGTSGELVLRMENAATGGRNWELNSKDSSGSFSIIDRTAVADRLLIDSSGNVGIGTTSPSAKLEVSGSTYGVYGEGSTYGVKGVDSDSSGSVYGFVGYGSYSFYGSGDIFVPSNTWGSCSWVTTTNSCDNTWTLYCPNGRFMAAIENVGGGNTCIKEIYCCQL